MGDDNDQKPARKTTFSVAPSFKSTAIEAAMAESERRARWADQIGVHPFADVGKQANAFADVGKHLRPFAELAEFANRIDKQMAPLRGWWARAGEHTRAQQDALAAGARKSHIAALQRLAEPRDSVVSTVQSIQDAKAEREAEKRAHQTAMVELLQGMVDRQDELLRRQDVQLEISRQTAKDQLSTRIAAHGAAVGALGAVLVVVAPAAWMQLVALPAAALLYTAALRIGTAIARRRA